MSGNHSFEDMLRYDMFKSVEEVKEFWEKNELQSIDSDSINQESSDLMDEVDSLGEKLKAHKDAIQNVRDAVGVL